MKNAITQPQHTQGRNWLRESPNSIWVEIMADETHVATIPYKTKEQQANAQRIVKTVNMHDELVKMLNEIKETINKSEEWWMDNPDKGGFDLVKKEALLKQAEQK